MLELRLEKCKDGTYSVWEGPVIYDSYDNFSDAVTDMYVCQQMNLVSEAMEQLFADMSKLGYTRESVRQIILDNLKG